jgi:ADP-ribose pyrophosphatase YjhB (NUDIX family)
VGAAAAIFNDQGHVLLVKHGYGPLNWELPGGGAEPNESAVETALRETREETGLIVEAARLAGIYHLAQNDSVHFVFRCQILAGEPAVADAAEITDCRYWPTDALPRPISDWTIRRIQDALSETPPALPLVIEKVNFVS